MTHDAGPPAPTAALSTLKIGARLIEDYEVERLLGTGGMGQVYLVRSRATGQRFAVKRTLQRDQATRSKFLLELQTWVNLPEHPNLVACRFFRTVGDELVIFSEFVEGDPLSEWIHSRRLASLDQILDVAIQIARGLHAVHERGVVHQDVKPSNVLLGEDGLARVVDFGLARFRPKLGPSPAGSKPADGLTPAYCSPEQAAGRPLTRQTDVWSWGVTVLEMFTGEVTWASGVAAGEALKEHQAAGAAPDLPAIPDALGNVLRRCLRKNPDDRWETMAALANAVASVSKRVTGKEYVERAPRTRGRPQPIAQAASPVARRFWTDPRFWLIEALRAEGRSLDEMGGMLSPPQQTQRAQAVADFAALEKARVPLLRLVKAGREEYLPALSCLYLDQATISDHAGDEAIACRLRDQVIKVYRHLVEVKDGGDLVGELARAFESKALGEHHRGRGAEAAALYDQARAARERRYDPEELEAHRAELASLDARSARTLVACADWDRGEEVAGRAITGLTSRAEQTGRDVLAVNLATAFAARGRAVFERGQPRAAASDAEAALAICDRLARRRARSEAARREADEHFREALTAGESYSTEAEAIQKVCVAAGTAFGPLGALVGFGAGLLGGAAFNVFASDQSRRRHLKEAIEPLSDLVEREGHVELAGSLARIYKRLAISLIQQENFEAGGQLFLAGYFQLQGPLQREGRHGLASRLEAARNKDGANEAVAPGTQVLFCFNLNSFDQSVADFDYLVPGLDPTELAACTATANSVQALALNQRKLTRQALEACDQSLLIWRRLTGVEGRWEFARDQAEACLAAARVCEALGDESRARASCEEAITTYQTLIDKGERSPLTGRIEETQRFLATLGRSGD